MSQLIHSGIFGGRFRPRGAVRTGAGGVTFEAEDRFDGRRVLVKVGEGAARDAVRREIDAVRGLFSGRIPALVAEWRDDRAAILVREFVEGRALGDTVPVADEATRRVLADIAEGLAYLHAMSRVHGDVKPENVVVDPGGRAHLVDFGVSQRGEHVSDEVSGTFAYLAPEARRGEVGPTGDVYAFGVLLGELRARNGGSLSPSFSASIRSLEARCTRDSPSERPTIEECYRDLAGRPPPIARALLESRFVGRAPELRTLAALGEPGVDRRVLVVSGPMGSGKSRLLDEFRGAARIPVIEARADSEGLAILDEALQSLDRRLRLVVVELDEKAPAQSTNLAGLAQRVRRDELLRLVVTSRDPQVEPFGEDAEHLHLSALSERELTPWLRSVDARDVASKVPSDAWFPETLLRLVEARDEVAAQKSSTANAASGSESATARALANVRRGAYAEALAVVRAARERGEDHGDEDGAHLAVTASLAEASLGNLDAAFRELAAVEARVRVNAPPRLRFRFENAFAIAHYRSGDLERATERYRVALELAEANGLDDVLVSAASNLGTAAHQVGDWGDALAAYERGLECATRRENETSARILQFNRARLLADIGALERAAEASAALGVVLSAEGGSGVLRGGLAAMESELAWMRGETERARRMSEEARALLRQAGAEREAAEVLASDWSALAHLETDDAEAAMRHFEGAKALFDIARARSWQDVEARALEAMGAFETSLGRGPSGVRTLEEASRTALSTNRRPLMATIASTLAKAYTQVGAETLAEEQAKRARTLWERTLTNLPLGLRETFRSHPERRGSFAATESERPGASSSLARFRLLLSINRRLAAATDASAVLEATMEAAVTLTAAERGFLLLRSSESRKEDLKVVMAKNMDKEIVRKAGAKFSRDIAERVVKTGESVVTADAGLDPTLSRSRSVHAMKLRSVLSVPIRSGDTVLGAIYLDNRFRPKAFDDDAVELVGALADQAGIALARARLLEELAVRTADLEHERERTALVLDNANREIADLRGTPRVSSPLDEFPAIVGRSPKMERMLDVVRRVRDIDVPVLIHGESGTGKELIARAIHETGARAKEPFLAINCGSMPEALLEAELFGHERGAFTGAGHARTGLLVDAGRGTVFFDEVGEMSLAMQVKLLRALQERKVRPVGASEERGIEARMLFATHRSLKDEVESGRFREDLYFRIAVVEVGVPPLRERTEDLPAIALTILERASAPNPPKRLTGDALRLLSGLPWPGNVRQLENVLKRAVVFTDADRIGAQDLGLETDGPKRRGSTAGEAQRIQAALRTHEWNVVEVSRSLGIPRASLYRKLRRYRIERPL